MYAQNIRHILYQQYFSIYPIFLIFYFTTIHIHPLKHMKSTPIPHSITPSSPTPTAMSISMPNNNIFPPKPKPTTKPQPSQSKHATPLNNTNNLCANIHQQLHKFITDAQLCVASVCQSYEKVICDSYECDVGFFYDDPDASFVRQLQAIQSLILFKNAQIKSLQHQISALKNSYNSNISQSNSFSSTSSTRNPLINQFTSQIKNQISYVQKMLEKLKEKKNMLRDSRNVGNSLTGVYLEKCLKQGREAWSYQEFVRELRQLGGVKCYGLVQVMGRDMKKSIQVETKYNNMKQKQKQKNPKDKLNPKNKDKPRDKLKKQQKTKNNVNENIIESTINAYSNKTNRQISQHKLSDIYNKVHQIKDTRTNTNPTYTHPHPYNYNYNYNNYTTHNSHSNTNHNTTPNSNINLNLNPPQPQIVLSPTLLKIKTLQKKTTMLQTALKSTKKKHFQQLTNYHNKLQFLYDENRILDNKLSLKIKQMENAQKRLQQGITTTTTTNNNPHHTITLTNTNANTSINDYYNINPTYPHPPYPANTNTNISIDNRLLINPLRTRNSTRKLSNKQPNRSENMMIRASY